MKIGFNEGCNRFCENHSVLEDLDLCEKYGFIAPLRPDLHPNGVHRGKHAGEIDKDLRLRCREYYIEHYGTEEQFRQEFFYSS